MPFPEVAIGGNTWVSCPCCVQGTSEANRRNRLPHHPDIDYPVIFPLTLAPLIGIIQSFGGRGRWP